MPGALGGGGGQPSPHVNYGSPGGTASIYQPQAQPAADTAYQQLLNQIYTTGQSGIGQLGGMSPAGQYWGATQNAANQYISNPYADSMMSAIQAIAPVVSSIGAGQIAYGDAIAPGAQTLMNAGNQVYQAGFDPQQALYDQTLGRVQDQTTASLANSGMLGTPYGAGLQSEALDNFNIGWENQQLGRETQGLAGLQSGYGGAANLLQRATGLQNAGLSQYLQGVGLPYQTSIGQAGNQFTGIGNAINYGNQAYYPAQLAMNDLQSYLQLGQAASGIGGQFAGLGNQQQLAGLGGLGTLAGLSSPLLFGSQGLPGALGLDPTTGLFGSLFGGAGGAGGGADLPAIFATAGEALAAPFGF